MARNLDGYGHVRELVDGRPIITSEQAEAAQYGTLRDALARGPLAAPHASAGATRAHFSRRRRAASGAFRARLRAYNQTGQPKFLNGMR
jgi:hypothetical protein